MVHPDNIYNISKELVSTNDVSPNVQGVVVKSVDVGVDFNNKQEFDDRDSMLTWIRRTVTRLVFGVVIGRSDNGPEKSLIENDPLVCRKCLLFRRQNTREEVQAHGSHPLVDIIDEIQYRIPYNDKRNIVKLEYRSPSVDNERKIVYSKFELKSQDDVRAVWQTYFSFEEKIPLELEATVRRTVDDILEMCKRPPGY